jgi:hypothetical protein
MNARTVLVVAVSLCACSAARSCLAQKDAGTPQAGVSAGSSNSLPSKLLLPGSAPVTGTVKTNRPQYEAGAPVIIEFTVVNNGKKPVVYDFPDAKRYDFTIADLSGRLIWTWSAGRKFAQTLGNVTIAPGKSYAAHAVWNGRDSQGRAVAPGTYVLTARLTSNNPPVVTGGLLINPESDPDNMGMTTRTPADSGAVRDVDVFAPVKAVTTFEVRGTGPKNG